MKAQSAPQSRKLGFALMALALILGSTSVLKEAYLRGILHGPMSEAQVAQVQNEAQKIFALDKSGQKIFPRNSLVTLSIALEFRDYEGASRLIAQLKR